MCEMCEGRTRDQYLDRLRGLIRTHGWALQAVHGQGRVGWVYTIGLTTGYGHPELLLIDTDVGRAARLLNGLGTAIRDGTVLVAGPTRAADGTELELVEVHPVHTCSDLLAMWHDVHGHLPDDDRPTLDVLQVRVPSIVEGGPRAVRERLDRAFARTP